MLSSARTFPCPNCNQLVMAGVETCRHCSSPIDAAVAEAAADIQEKANAAYSDAMVIRNLAVGMWVFFLIRFIPFIGIVGWLGMGALLLGVPVKLIIWQVKFGRIKTNDPDYKKARTNRLIAFLIWLPLPLLIVFFFGLLLLAALATGRS
jgi:hypothetical protein